MNAQEANGEQREKNGGKFAETDDFGRAVLKRKPPETAPTLGKRAKKIPTDKGWDFTLWWSWREPKGNTHPKSTIYFFVKNQTLNKTESLTRDTPVLGWHPKMESRVYPLGRVRGRLAFADAGSIPHFFKGVPRPAVAARRSLAAHFSRKEAFARGQCLHCPKQAGLL